MENEEQEITNNVLQAETTAVTDTDNPVVKKSYYTKKNVAIDDTFREKMKQYRLANSLTVKKAAELCGINFMHYYYIEKGHEKYNKTLQKRTYDKIMNAINGNVFAVPLETASEFTPDLTNTTGCDVNIENILKDAGVIDA